MQCIICSSTNTYQRLFCGSFNKNLVTNFLDKVTFLLFCWRVSIDKTLFERLFVVDKKPCLTTSFVAILRGDERHKILTPSKSLVFSCHLAERSLSSGNHKKKYLVIDLWMVTHRICRCFSANCTHRWILFRSLDSLVWCYVCCSQILPRCLCVVHFC